MSPVLLTTDLEKLLDLDLGSSFGVETPIQVSEGPAGSPYFQTGHQTLTLASSSACNHLLDILEERGFNFGHLADTVLRAGEELPGPGGKV